MTLVKRNQTAQFPNVLDDFLKADWFGGTANGFAMNTPAVNVIEREDSFSVQVAAPGMKKEDFNIELDNDILSISAERQSGEENKEKGKYTRREFSFSTFKRNFNLPDTINNAEINAEYVNGVLQVTLPKREEAKTQPKRLIEIS